MALSKNKKEVVNKMMGNGGVQVIISTIIEEDGSEISKSSHKRVLKPSDDLSEYSQHIQDICNAHWNHYTGEEPTTEELEQQKRNRMVLEAGDFHSAINLLHFDGTSIQEVYDENGDDTGLTPISDAINTAITQLPKRDQVKFSKLLEKRSKFRRTNSEVIQIATAIGMDETQMDEFFEKAKTL